MSELCTHLDAAALRELPPSVDGCEECCGGAPGAARSASTSPRCTSAAVRSGLSAVVEQGLAY